MSNPWQPRDKNIKEFYFQHFRKLYDYAGRTVKNKDEARYIVDNAFIKAIQKKVRFKEKEKALSWLYKAVEWGCIDYYRKHKSDKQDEAEYEQWLRGQPDAFEDPAVIKEETFQILKDAIEKLSPREREVIKAWMNHYGTAREIAASMGIAETTFSNIKRNALVKLRLLVRRGDAVVWLIIKLILSDEWKN